MINGTIIRVDTNPKYGTFGVFLIDGELFCYTLEPYSRFNLIGFSSIQTGQYPCVRYSSRKYPNTFEITNVAFRSKLLFHAGNIVKNTKGCVILGQCIDKLKGDRALLNSGRTFKEFLRRLEGVDSFNLTIKEVY